MQRSCVATWQHRRRRCNLRCREPLQRSSLAGWEACRWLVSAAPAQLGSPRLAARRPIGSSCSGSDGQPATAAAQLGGAARRAAALVLWGRLSLARRWRVRVNCAACGLCVHSSWQRPRARSTTLEARACRCRWECRPVHITAHLCCSRCFRKIVHKAGVLIIACICRSALPAAGLRAACDRRAAALQDMDPREEQRAVTRDWQTHVLHR